MKMIGKNSVKRWLVYTCFILSSCNKKLTQDNQVNVSNDLPNCDSKVIVESSLGADILGGTRDEVLQRIKKEFNIPHESRANELSIKDQYIISYEINDELSVRLLFDNMNTLEAYSIDNVSTIDQVKNGKQTMLNSLVFGSTPIDVSKLYNIRDNYEVCSLSGINVMRKEDFFAHNTYKEGMNQSLDNHFKIEMINIDTPPIYIKPNILKNYEFGFNQLGLLSSIRLVYQLKKTKAKGAE